MSPRQHYLQDLQQRGFQRDAAQEKALAALEELYRRLTVGQPASGSWLSRLRGREQTTARGLYLWGGVGRGKTYLVDRFIGALPLEGKQRLHFQSLMQQVHQRLRQLPKTPDPLPLIAAEMARGQKVISLDEFHVDDIADAMLLAGLLQSLVDQGVTLLFTSNQHPDQLYPNGLQRDRFLPAIALIKHHCDVLHLDGPVDYRTRAGEEYPGFFWGRTEEALASMRSHFEGLHGGAPEYGAILRVNERPLAVLAKGPNVAWFEFSTLCATARNASDYLALADSFDTILLSGLPTMTGEHEDVAARFIALIDALYDRRVRLLMSASCPLDALYTGRAQDFAFQRTVSRLREMLSSGWKVKAR